MTLPRNTLKRRLAPGLWEDAEGNAHWSIPELLQLAGLEDTPQNQTIARQMLADMLAEQMPQTTIIHREKPD